MATEAQLASSSSTRASTSPGACGIPGKTGWYAPDIVIHHPVTDPARHATFYRLVARIRSRANLKVWISGLVEGLRGGHGERRPMSWTTVWRLTRAGRPPIV